MPDYKTMCFRLFNRVSDAIELLKQAQQEGEETFISTDDNPSIELIQSNDRKKEIPPD